MSAFAETTRAYESSGRASVYVVNADPGPIATIARAHSHIRRLARDEDDLAGLAERLRFARYRLSTSILPPAHRELELDELAAAIGDYAVEYEPGTQVHHITGAALQALDAARALDVTPLARHALDALAIAPAGQRFLALADSRRVVATSSFLDEHATGAHVVPASRLREVSDADTIVCIGPIHFFPPAVWNAARADSICFVRYPFGAGALPTGGLFGDDGRLASPRFRTSGTAGSFEDIETMDINEELAAAAQRVRKQRGSGPGSDRAIASLLLLEGGNAVWTASEDGSWMWTVDLDGEAPAVVHRRTATIGAGAYVVFREEGAASDLVSIVADRRHGASKLRPRQRRWKEALLAAVNGAGGINAATAAIMQRGATTANVRHWIAPHSIRPTRRQDFDAACAFAGITDEADHIWAALSEINRAHLRAGQTIRRMLTRRLVEDGAEELRSRGIQKLEIEGLGTLSAYRVVYRHPEPERVDRDCIDRPFMVQETGWLE